MNFENILLRHNKSVLASRRDADITVEFGGRTFASPVVMANMKSVITRPLAKQFAEKGWYYVYHRIDGVSDVRSFAEWSYRTFPFCSISVGVKNEWVKLVEQLKHMKVRPHYITVDVALSYSDNVLPVLEAIREHQPQAFVTLGNGATHAWAAWCYSTLYKQKLINAVKVGIGVSASCRTRQYTGFGSTTLGSLDEVTSALGGTGLKVISDGGITVKNGEPYIGDVTKALVFGADMIMSGALFSHCSDVPAAKDGYFGNASAKAKGDTWHVEGESISTHKEEKKTVKEMMYLIQDSLRSSVSYSGGRNIEEMKKLTKYKVIK